MDYRHQGIKIINFSKLVRFARRSERPLHKSAWNVQKESGKPK
jgi:hypothetical protein